jgi:type IV pilus assembly protein PilA
VSERNAERDAGVLRRRDGFTLVEVIVVLVILAILAAIAIPALTGYIDKTQHAEIKLRAREMTMATQTILNEAYIDPQSEFASGGLGSHTILYAEGMQVFDHVYIDGNLWQINFKAIVSDGGKRYLYESESEGAPLLTINPTNAGIDPLLWKLTKIPTMKATYNSGNIPGTYAPTVNSNLQIVAYGYRDPYLWTNESGTWETYGCSYNLDLAVGDYFALNMYTNISKYNPDTGQMLFKVGSDGIITKLL